MYGVYTYVWVRLEREGERPFVIKRKVGAFEYQVEMLPMLKYICYNGNPFNCEAAIYF